MSNRRVVVTGIGWVTPLGHDIETVWQNLLEGKSGVSTTELFEADTYPTRFSAQVKNFSLSDILDDISRFERASRNSMFALGAAEQAWRSAGLYDDAAIDLERVGVYLGGGEGPLDFDRFVKPALAGSLDDEGRPAEIDTRKWTRKALDTLDLHRELEQDSGMAASHIARHFEALGPNLNTLTACAASTQAIGEATNLIRRGDADIIVSGGAHSMIHPLGVTGFNRLTALSNRNEKPQGASRPFDRHRDGFVLGEGAGIVVLEEMERAVARGASMFAEIKGFGSTADAFRITDIHEEGRGAIAAMRDAINSAGIDRQDIDYISAHGTGTQENDQIETLAIKSVFEDYSSNIPISSIKSMMGHLIAAAGAVELITCILAIRDGMIPPTINYKTPDPKCDLDYVPNQSRKVPVKTALSNSFGFGGQNDCLVVQAV